MGTRVYISVYCILSSKQGFSQREEKVISEDSRYSNKVVSSDVVLLYNVDEMS